MGSSEVTDQASDPREGPAILIVTAGMGGGHLGAARELAWRLERRGYRAPTFDLLAAMRYGYGRFITAFYRAQLQHAMWSYRVVYEQWRRHPERLTGANALNTRMARDPLLAALARHRPVAVLSTYNLATQVLGALIDRGEITVPSFTFVTDFGVHPYWLHDAMAGYCTVHESTALQVQRLTSAPVVVTGPFVSRAFRPDAERRAATRSGLGISDAERVALVVAGAWGVGDLEATIADLDRIGGWTPLVVCGDNPRLAGRLRRTARRPDHVLGFVDTMPALMDAADVLIENAGGLTTMEAFASELPVVTYRPIPAHGTDNANAMATAGVTRFAPDRTALAGLLTALADGEPMRSAMIDAGRCVQHPDGITKLTALVDPRRSAAGGPDRRASSPQLGLERSA